MGSRKVVVFVIFLQALLCLIEEASSVGVVSKPNLAPYINSGYCVSNAATCAEVLSA